MRLAVATVVFFAAFAAAMVNSTKRADEPIHSCAHECLNDSRKSVTDCAEEDLVCMCNRNNMQEIRKHSKVCINDRCGYRRAQRKVYPAIRRMCREAQKAGRTRPCRPKHKPKPMPKCARPCLDDARDLVTNCDEGDTACLCCSMKKVVDASMGCLYERCNKKMLNRKVFPALKAMCRGTSSSFTSSKDSPDWWPWVVGSTKVAVPVEMPVLPTCAEDCMDKQLMSLGECRADDRRCECAKMKKVVDASKICSTKECNFRREYEDYDFMLVEQWCPEE